MRIGQGFDIHRLEFDKPLILGGVLIPFEKGIVAHSDGDVLLHAICDALLGAAGLGDIGMHFPDTDPRFKAVSSREFLREILKWIQIQGFYIENIDTTIIAERPKLAPYIDMMRDNIVADLGIEKSCINIKAKTMERLDAVGAGEAIAAQAVVLLM